jgi:hypothetical protein
VERTVWRPAGVHDFFSNGLTGQTVTITVPSSSANWQVDFYDTRNGTTILSSVAVVPAGTTVVVPLPDFKDDIAFKMVLK